MRISSNNNGNARKYGIVKNLTINYFVKTCLTHS
nr:MAG TPA: hypothetical protein [Bacteriophage sp.]